MDSQDWLAVVLALISGIGGVAVGALIAQRAVKQERERLERGAARLAYFELAENAIHLNAAISSSSVGPLRTTAWPDARARLADMLPADEFAAVARAYMKIAALDARWAAGGNPKEGWPSAQDTLARVEGAIEVLWSVAFDDASDREMLELDLADDVREAMGR